MYYIIYPEIHESYYCLIHNCSALGFEYTVQLFYIYIKKKKN